MLLLLKSIFAFFQGTVFGSWPLQFCGSDPGIAGIGSARSRVYFTRSFRYPDPSISKVTTQRESSFQIHCEAFSRRRRIAFKLCSSGQGGS